jgi:DNA-binding NarL/FixJ family response regulator
MKVAIIDDEKAMHFVMKHILAKCKDVEIVGCFQETAAAYSFLSSHDVDLIFIDISMPRENGLDFAKRVRESGWQAKLVFVTSHKEYALAAFDVYAYDYMVKPISQARVLSTIERALSETKAREGEGADSRSYPPLVEPLTKREVEVLSLMSNGMSNKEIAENFQISEGTVKNHLVNIFGKLQVRNRVQAISAAKENQLI